MNQNNKKENHIQMSQNKIKKSILNQKMMIDYIN
jgi:hypothetical protein